MRDREGEFGHISFGHRWHVDSRTLGPLIENQFDDLRVIFFRPWFFADALKAGPVVKGVRQIHAPEDSAARKMRYSEA